MAACYLIIVRCKVHGAATVVMHVDMHSKEKPNARIEDAVIGIFEQVNDRMRTAMELRAVWYTQMPSTSMCLSF